MTSDIRAAEIVEWAEDEGYPRINGLHYKIASAIRAAEADALERAIQIVNDPNVYEWDVPERIRALIHSN